MRKSTMTAVAVLALCGQAFAQVPEDGSYFCTVESSGGLSFNNSEKRWEGTRFKSTERFVLKLHMTGKRTVPHLFDKNRTDQVYDYDVWLTQAGKSSPSRCFGMYPTPFSEKVVVRSVTRILCNSSLTEYQFNLETNRFLSAYLRGFVDGEDNNDNTPAVSAGTCTKI